MTYNYQSRIEDFVLEVIYKCLFKMTKSPIIVNDRTKRVQNPREELYQSTKKYIIGRKGIILKDYNIKNESKDERNRSDSSQSK